MARAHWKSSGTGPIMRGTSGRGYWIAQGLEPPEDMPAPSELRDEPTVEIWLERARESFAANDFVLVDAQTSALLRLDPTNAQAAEALRMRAMVNAIADFYADAVRDAEEALRLDPDATTGRITADEIAWRAASWRVLELWDRDRP